MKKFIFIQSMRLFKCYIVQIWHYEYKNKFVSPINHADFMLIGFAITPDIDMYVSIGFYTSFNLTAFIIILILILILISILIHTINETF